MIFDKHTEYGLFRVAPHDAEGCGVAMELVKELRDFVQRPYKRRVHLTMGSTRLEDGTYATTMGARYKPVPRDG